ncbi:hypothetical protein BU17DRAFT_65272 [Hysterangium stoloniferum]|nr:hypothetical protein BU17DRAFT_65272 [Hysterangium stoloniferum]
MSDGDGDGHGDLEMEMQSLTHSHIINTPKATRIRTHFRPITPKSGYGYPTTVCTIATAATASREGNKVDVDDVEVDGYTDGTGGGTGGGTVEDEWVMEMEVWEWCIANTQITLK